MSKLILIPVVTLALVWCLGGVVQGFTYDDKEVETEEGKSAMFERWRSHHKMEKISEKEKKLQFNNFKANLKIVHETNKANKPYKLEMNHLAGKTIQEIKSKHTGLKKKNDNFSYGGPFRYSNFTNLPPSIDWRTLGGVTPVKNQDACGSCYAFAAVDAVEGMHFVRNKELIQLSPKEIVDCGPEKMEHIKGCSGGFMTSTFEYIETNGGLTTEKNYPYVPKEDPCNVKKEHDIAVQVGGHENVPASEEDLMKAVANQPVAVAYAVEEPFNLYKEGILTEPCVGKILEHGSLLVGYDTAPDGTKYWIVKNSWSENFGEKGYVRMQRGLPGNEGYCGLTMFSSYPTPDKTCTPHKEGEHMVHESQEL